MSRSSKTSKTLVVNLFAGPGAGKSTTAYGILYKLKSCGIDVEFADEYAKTLVYEDRDFTFNDQIYLFAKQNHRVFNLLGQVDVIVTDCPILLSPVYDALKRPTFKQLVVEEHNKNWTYNAFIRRAKKYNPEGRIHTEVQARQIDRDVMDLLYETDQCFEVMDGNEDGVNNIVKKILVLLQHKQ